jgi:hypothetical protein
VSARGAYYDDGKLGIEFFDSGDEVAASHVADTSVEYDTVDLGKCGQSFDGLSCAVGGDNVEFGGLDDELAGGDAAGIFAIDDEKAGPDHVFDYGAMKAAMDSSPGDIVGVRDFLGEALLMKKVLVCGACRFESKSTVAMGKTGSGNKNIGKVGRKPTVGVRVTGTEGIALYRRHISIWLGRLWMRCMQLGSCRSLARA